MTIINGLGAILAGPLPGRGAERPSAAPRGEGTPIITAPPVEVFPCAGGATVQPGESVQAAIDAAPAGSTVKLAPGTFTENIVIDKSIKLQGAGANRTTLEPADDSQPLITIVADDVTVTGIRLAGGSVGIAVNGHSCLIENNEINGAGQGITLTGGGEIFGNKIIGCAQEGISIADADGVTLAGNIVARGGGDGIAAADSTGVTISNNTVVRNEGSGVSLANTAASLVNNIITKNLTGITVVSGEVPAVTFNDIWANDNNCSGVGGGVLDFSGELTNINNTPVDAFHNISEHPIFLGEGEKLFDSEGWFYAFNYEDDDYNLSVKQDGYLSRSPCLEAGDPALDDHDLTKSDIGAYGGPNGLYDRPPLSFGLTEGEHKVVLNWVAPADVPVLGYRLYRLPIELSEHDYVDPWTLNEKVNQPYELLADITDPETTEYEDADFPADQDMVYFYKAVTVHGPNESRGAEEIIYVWMPWLDADASVDGGSGAEDNAGCKCSAVGGRQQRPASPLLEAIIRSLFGN